MSRILLLIEQQSNRKLLEMFLAAKHEVILAKPDTDFSESFDLCLIDGINLDRHWARIADRRKSEIPAHLPFLLVTAKTDIGLATRYLSNAIDDLIVTPIEKIELQVRLDSLLDARHLSMEFNRSLIAASPLAIAAVDRENLVRQWNPSAERLFGWSRQQVLGTPLSIKSPDDKNVVEVAIERVFADNKSVDIETRLIRQDGTSVDVMMVSAPVRLNNGKVVAALEMFQDISQRKNAEIALKQSNKQIEAALMGTVEVAMTISEMRDPYTAGHERRVADIAVAIAQELGFDEAQLEGIRIAGCLHDIGKITIPAEILVKPGKLTKIEYQLIQSHAQASYDILHSVEFHWPIAQMVLQHHERMDGSGYPQGLKGDSILLEARILAVADVVEAMCSHRPYRPGLGIDKALAEIERGCATIYDPSVASACLKLFREKGFFIPEAQ